MPHESLYTVCCHSRDHKALIKPWSLFGVIVLNLVFQVTQVVEDQEDAFFDTYWKYKFDEHLECSGTGEKQLYMDDGMPSDAWS